MAQGERWRDTNTIYTRTTAKTTMATNGDSEEFIISYLMKEPDEDYDLFPEAFADHLLSAARAALSDIFQEKVVNWDQVVWLTKACPTICGEKDKNGMLPLHHACYANAPFHVISFLVTVWPTSAMDCGRDWMKNEKDDRGYLPVMYLLENEKRDVEAIEYLSLSKFEYIGEYDPNEDHTDIGRAMFRLKNDDPFLEGLVLGVGSTTIGDESEMLHLFDSIRSHLTINYLHLVWDDVDSLLWTGALRTALRNNTSISSITVTTSNFDLSHIEDVVGNCQQLKRLLIIFEASPNGDELSPNGDEIAAFALSIHKLPLMKFLLLEGASIGEEGAIALTKMLFKNRSMRELILFDGDMSKRAASIFVDALKNDKAHSFTDLSLFSRPNNRCFRRCRLPSWEVEIEHEIRELTSNNRLQASIEKFVHDELVEYVVDRELRGKCFGNGTEDRIFAAMANANREDRTDYYPRHPPNCLYALIRASPDWIGRAIDHAGAIQRMKKRQRLMISH